MEASLLYSSLTIVFLVIAITFISSQKSHRLRNLPPSPPGLPVIGHLHLVKKPLHRFLQELAQKLGPVFSLRFGSHLVVVVSTSPAVEECFTKNDVVLANRPRFLGGKYFGYNYTGVSVTPYGDHWRNLRRIMAVELFSPRQLSSSLSIRRDEIKFLLQGLHKISSNEFAKIELKSKFLGLNFNIVMRILVGKRYYGDEFDNNVKAKEFQELVRELFSASPFSGLNDYLPILRWIDYANFEKTMARSHGKIDRFLQGLIDEHRRDKSNNSMIDRLLSLQELEPEFYTDETIRAFIMIMILAGPHTTAVAMEWTMALLLNHPEVLNKARVEIDAHVGQERLINESDLSKLNYLRAVILESFRLFPSVPLLLPHMSSENCTIGGFNVPPSTIVLVNTWAVHRDPEIWNDATSFKPERFEGGEVEVQKLLPFGMGRRACPGVGLAQRIMGLTLGSLIQCFEWKRVGKEFVDMAGGGGVITISKVVPLEVKCKARNILDNNVC
ncbi:unnamed protein product [Thlaspi arvense]|uniref:Cytochrome P450 n=1 Tax=Thlaspi arvense TaxID=13288 RepID=A0AAU9TCC8_THLAR|nr:unnamed protein product [Thlaspi arvense]